MLQLKVIAKIKALCQANRQLHFGVTVQTKQGHDSAWRDFIVGEEYLEERQI